MTNIASHPLVPIVLLSLAFAGCAESTAREQEAAASSCIKCHNGSKLADYSGPGIENPHPFPGADNLACVTCHGGNNQGFDKDSSHVPPPPEIGGRERTRTNRAAWFNKLTLTGLDQYADYTVGGVTYTALDFLQFVNPGDLRVTGQGRGCGQCHAGHAETVAGSVLATETGIFSGAMFAAGVTNQVVANQGLYEDTAADLAFRAVVDPDFVYNASVVGPVGSLIQYPVYAERGGVIHGNAAYSAANLANDVDPTTNRLISGSKLAQLYHEQIAFTCGDCHLGSAGANNRSGDYRSSGCSACHMPYSLGGRAGSRDPNLDRTEPLNPDNIQLGEEAHTRSHQIRSVSKTLPSGVQVQGIDDLTCAGCHQGSNRTVMQYWGIRLDQNQDVRRGVQYPANPVSFRNTRTDTRLFDPVLGNNQFNGRNANQYLAFEDYDGDGRDDTPPDVHHEAGLGCIDCHGSFDLHGGDVANGRTNIDSRMEHTVSIKCESCHGTATAYAQTSPGTSYDGTTRDLAMDKNGKAINHVFRDTDGYYYLVSRLTGKRHYVSQTLDTIVDNGRVNTLDGNSTPIYNAIASYAMGRDDNSAATGTGPQQTGSPHAGFSHMDNMSCVACHASWTNNCVGCHLIGEYNTGANFSNINGKQIVFREQDAQFVYQSPLMFQLGVGPDNKITQFSSNTKMFFTYQDLTLTKSQVFSFADRKGQGNQPGVFGALGHNAMMAHSIRGRVSASNEGPRYCAACHLTTSGLATHGTTYNSFRSAMASNSFGSLDFNMLKVHIGQNPGNRLNSPVFVHMVAGLGSGVFLFDKDGCPENPLDTDANRQGCNGVAPATSFNAATVRFNLDRLVNNSGVSSASNNHPMLDTTPVPSLRDGSTFPLMSGPLGSTLVNRLTDPSTGIILNSWVDADRAIQGDGGLYIK